MTRYFLHLRDGNDELLDLEGEEHASTAALAASLLRSACSIMSADVGAGVLDLRFRIDAEDAKGKVVHTQPFTSALQIIRAGG